MTTPLPSPGIERLSACRGAGRDAARHKIHGAEMARAKGQGMQQFQYGRGAEPGGIQQHASTSRAEATSTSAKTVFSGTAALLLPPRSAPVPIAAMMKLSEPHTRMRP